DPAVPVPPRAVEDGGLHAAAESLLDLREQGGRRTAEQDVVDGTVAPLAGGARGAHRVEADGCDGDSRLLRAAGEVAGRAARGQSSRMVEELPALNGQQSSSTAVIVRVESWKEHNMTVIDLVTGIGSDEKARADMLEEFIFGRIGPP